MECSNLVGDMVNVLEVNKVADMVVAELATWWSMRWPTRGADMEVVADTMVNMEVDKVADTVAHMKVEMVADMVVNEVANMLANMEVDKVVDMVADMEVDKVTDKKRWSTWSWTW